MATSVLAMRYASLLHPGAHNSAAPVQASVTPAPANTTATLDHVVFSSPSPPAPAPVAAPAPAPVAPKPAPYVSPAPVTLAFATPTQPSAYELAMREANQRQLDEQAAQIKANQALIDSWKKVETAAPAPATAAAPVVIQVVGPSRADGLAELGYAPGYANELANHNPWNMHYPPHWGGGWGHGWHGGGGGHWHGHHC